MGGGGNGPTFGGHHGGRRRSFSSSSASCAVAAVSGLLFIWDDNAPLIIPNGEQATRPEDRRATCSAVLPLGGLGSLDPRPEDAS